jgi:hypothetical protein
MELLDLERKIKNNIEVSKIKQNLLEGFLNELQKIGDEKGKNSFGNRDTIGDKNSFENRDTIGDENTFEKINTIANEDIDRDEDIVGDRENMLESEFRKEGEIYEVDEIGDDEKYVFLTRLSDKAQMQEFDISNKLYNELLNCKNEELKVVFHNGEYKIIT